MDVYLSSRLTKVERIDKRLKLADELANFLKTDSIDFIIINDASSVINFEI